MRRCAPDAEARLWARLRAFNERGFCFRRKSPYGGFILDFVEHDRRLVIELDDGEPGKPRVRHVARDHVLKSAGYTILRIWKTDAIHDFGGVVSTIKRVLEDRPLSAKANLLPNSRD